MIFRLMIPFMIFLLLSIMALALVYVYQEKLIFFPEKLKENYLYQFDQRYEEMHLKMDDGVMLNGLLFKTEQTKGLIFYLHGNAGSLRTWGEVGKVYTEMGFDVFIFDYRGYGKSEGSIDGMQQLTNDVQNVYDFLKKRYDEDKTIILGYSIGTGPASKLAATNNPRLLILQAPYYSLTDLVIHYFPIFPTFLLKYTFENHQNIEQCKMPVIIFHGDKDEVIYFGSSLKLKKHFKDGDTLIILKGQQHNGMTFDETYQFKLKKLID
ncbi:MAG: alpha/beta hydrolase [Cyclobacteriaceae bacterium]